MIEPGSAIQASSCLESKHTVAIRSCSALLVKESRVPVEGGYVGERPLEKTDVGVEARH